MMEDGDIDSDIPDLSGDEEEAVCFDEDEIVGLKVKDGEKVEEGHEDSFGTESMHSKGERGAGFVDRKGGFFQTNITRKGNEVADGGSSSFVAAAIPVTDVNQSEPIMPTHVSPVRLAEDVMPNGPTQVVDDMDGERASDSLSQPPGFRRKKSSSSCGSTKLLKKKVPVVVDDIGDVLKQYFEMGGLLGYDMESNKDRVKKILSSIGMVQVDQ
ncbi:unnamed protein product [Lactuca virosa]|uniref:Uncharacterized protein n=1 Tax=Lactuca virosa TaxID=75947 RepID=A0AAU9NBJ5_9ASTR|nr:unnamed protein product [Lactuca virosa]